MATKKLKPTTAGRRDAVVDDFSDITTADPYKPLLAPLTKKGGSCLLYTSPSPRDLSTSRMPSSA